MIKGKDNLFGYLKEERVRKSSLAKPGTKGRKKSVVSFSSEDTKTIEYEEGSGNASPEVDKFDEDKIPTPGTMHPFTV